MASPHVAPPLAGVNSNMAQSHAVGLIREALRAAPNARELEAQGFEIRITVRGRKFEVVLNPLTPSGLILP